jgi:hypothetical protein
MWCIEDLQLRPIAFDFQSSGQGVHHGRSLYADGTMIVNDIDLADLTSSSCQVIVCDECGTIGCASGNWVVMRRLGAGVIWIPDFGRMLVGDFEQWQAAPAGYLRSRGVPLFAGASLARLQSIVPSLSVEAMPRLRVWEAARLLQWEAPGNVLGRFPEAPVLRKEIVLASHPGERTDRCRDLDRLLAGVERSDLAVDVSPSASTVISFYLDLPGTPEWQPIAQSPAGEVTWNFAEASG